MISFDDLYQRLMVRKVTFVLVFFVTVVITYGILFAIDFIPEPINDNPTQPVDATIKVENTDYTAKNNDFSDITVEPVVASPLPVKIVFDSLDREVEVLNPVSREIADLDEALLEGAVRHPDSADFEHEGNIFILAHSSYLPNVLNKNFQAFNGIQELTWGDKIRLYSEDTEYIYRVEKVYEAKASEVFVPETPGEANLTLATCNSFGSQDDRYMVEARLIGAQPIASQG